MSKFRRAGVTEILGSAEKDDYYMQYAKNLCAESVQGLFGISHWLRWQSTYEKCTDFTYFLLTTISGLQTLGEEYVHVVQIDSSLKKLPSRKRLVLSVFLHIFGPHILQYLQASVMAELNKTKEKDLLQRIRLQRCLKLLSCFTWLSSFLQRLHFVIFFFNGTFYDFSKRITGIKYVVIRHWLKNLASQKLYNVLGTLAAIQLCISLGKDVHYFLTNKNSILKIDDLQSDSTDAQDVTSRNQCSLCLGMRKDTTVTPCGHLFCWNCITSCLQNKEVCPLCRETCPLSRIVYLQNYT